MGAMYGLGFVHAMDRLWQLEFMRKLSSGRLSELFGSETLIIDKHIRTIGIPRMAEKYMSEASEADLIILANYAAGVNKVVE
jgi:penicillin amidase